MCLCQWEKKREEENTRDLIIELNISTVDRGWKVEDISNEESYPL